MDRLDHLSGAAAPLLRRVDEILTAAGAPAAHPVWELLRRVRLLTVDAVAAVTGLRPDSFVADTPDLRSRAAGYVEAAANLPAPEVWSGEAAEAYDAARRRLADHLSGDPESLAERLEASADLADALADWMRRGRSAVAAALADVLGSVEAVRLAVEDGAEPVPVPLVVAAADVAARVLHAVAEVYEEATELLDGTVDLAVAAPAPGSFPPAWS
jgi:hypothetical protein